MPIFHYNIPMATEQDGLRFRRLWALIRDDENVVQADVSDRPNPFIQGVSVEICDDQITFFNWLLGMELDQFRTRHETPISTPGTTPASATPNLSWQTILPAGARVGSRIHLESQAFVITRIDPAQNCVWLQSENGLGRHTIALESSRNLVLASDEVPALPPKTEQPDPDSLWARLLEPSFDD